MCAFVQSAPGIDTALVLTGRQARESLIELADTVTDDAGIRAVIGPAISQQAYEVGHDFADNFIAADPDNSRFFSRQGNSKPRFDLPAYGLSRLKAAGVQNATWTGDCTYSDPDRFYSFRRTTHREEPDYGRLISAICL